MVGIAVVGYWEYSNRNEPPKKEIPTQGYFTDMMNIKNTAQKNINEAVEKENNKINKTLMENPKMELVQKYDRAVIKTSLGDITIKFYGDLSPKTVENFLKLSNQKFYDGVAFHRVIKGFMIQGGDPLSKEIDWTNVPVGTGDPGYKFADEFNSQKLVRGSLAMANAGPDTNGSQFFIVTAEATPHLDGRHTNFGEVISGIEVIDKIENAQTNQMDQPLEKIRIISIELIEKQK